MLDLPPARGTYLLYKLVFELNKDVIVDQQQQESSTWDLNSICKILNITDQDTKQHKRIEKYIKRNVQEGIIEQQKDGKISLRKRYASTWSRIKKLVISIGNQIFYSDAKTNNNPFMIEEKAQYGQIKKKWITTLDLGNIGHTNKLHQQELMGQWTIKHTIIGDPDGHLISIAQIESKSAEGFDLLGLIGAD
jgi:hypothetical protein